VLGLYFDTSFFLVMHSNALAGQHLATEGKPKKTSLFLNITESGQSAGVLELNVGSPFTLSRSMSPKSNTATVPTPCTATFFNRDKEITTTDPLIDGEDEGDVQIITIAPGKPFFLSPSFSCAPMTPTFVRPMTFGCGALDDTFSKTVAQVFHEELERILQLNGRDIVFDAECLQEMEVDLLVSPVEAFSESCIDSMRVYSPVSPTAPIFRALPDVPHDLESEFSDEEADGGLEEMAEDLGDDDDYSSDEAITPLNRAAFSTVLDKRLIVTSEEEHYNRYSVSPSKPLFCGFLS